MSIETAGVALGWKVFGGVLIGGFNVFLAWVGWKVRKSSDKQDKRIEDIETVQKDTYRKQEVRELVDTKILPVKQKQVDLEDKFNQFLKTQEKISEDLNTIITSTAVIQTKLTYLEEDNKNHKLFTHKRSND